MYCSIMSMAINGVGALPVTVEADLSEGMPSFNIVGSVSTQVREAQDRVRTALKNLRISLPPKRLTLNLAPGDIRKDGTRFDLPIAAAILCVLEKIPEEALSDTMLIGELHLDSEIVPVPGVLPSIIKARELGIKCCIVPAGNANEAGFVENMKIIGIHNLTELISYCTDGVLPETGKESASSGAADVKRQPDFADIKGQESVKRACLISAAGFHNLLLCGPPGSGKSMAARRLSGILPEMTPDEQLEVSQIYSVAGLLSSEMPLITRRPFRSPHHSLSAQALCGGGRIPKPGEISLAHRGVLFIDELPEMQKHNLNVLRQPLEDHVVTISRVYSSFTFPAAFLFAAAMNPCPCGYWPDMNKCTCSASEVRSYLAKLSQPILDRIDLRVDVPAVRYEDLTSKDKGLSSADMQAMVSDAFEVQKDRYKALDLCFNSELEPAQIKKFCPLSSDASRLLEAIFSGLGLSGRSYHRILKIARTIADLEHSDIINEAHVSEALCFRQSQGEQL